MARAVVDLADAGGVRVLTAWVEPADTDGVPHADPSARRLDPEALRAAAARWLPAHAVPRSVVSAFAPSVSSQLRPSASLAMCRCQASRSVVKELLRR